MTHPSPKRNMVPKAVLMRSGLVSLTTARPVNTAQPRTTVNSARPITNVFNKAHSTVRRPINNKTTSKNRNFNEKVNTARPKAVLNAVKGNQVNTARPKAVLNAVKGNQVNTARPKAVLNAVKGNNVNVGNSQQDLQDQGVIDSGRKACDDTGKARMETVPGKDYILLPLWTVDPPFSQSSKSSPDVGFKPSGDDEKKVTEEPGKEGGDPSKEGECNDQDKEDNVNSANNINAASINEVNVVDAKTSIELSLDPNMPKLEDYNIFKIMKMLVAEGFTEVKTASTPIETQKPLLMDEDGEEVDVHMYRSMIGSLMYLQDLTSCLQCVPVLDTKSI
ncbi:hypothetical protein Tco_0996823 [Tanacetum coccineum]